MSIIERHAVSVTGLGPQAIVFLHGYGCDSNMWRRIVPAFSADYKIVTYDLMGYGRSATENYDPVRYATLNAHASDLIAILEALQLENVTAVGHSVSAMTVGLAANLRPDLISRLVMICPSPSYIDDGDYKGGFEPGDLYGLLELLDVNYLGWVQDMAPQIMGAPDRPELADELANSLCRTEPDIAKHFAKVTFLGDHRQDVRKITQPTLVLQCNDDILVPPTVWTWMTDNMPAAELAVLDATGHCPHISAPEPTSSAISNFLRPARAR